MKLRDGLLLAAAALAAGTVGVADYVARSLTVKPKPALDGDYTLNPWDMNVPFEEVTFASADGLRLAGWLFSHPDEQRVIVACSGFNGSKDQLVGIGTWLWRRGFNVLLFDYRGQGQSDPAMTTLGHAEVGDWRAAVDFVCDRFPGARVGALGFSMGGATTILGAAVDERVRAVAVDGPFAELKTTVGNIFRAKTHLPTFPFMDVAEWLVQWRAGYRLGAVVPLQAVSQISPRPLLIVGGTADTTCYFSEQEKLYAAAGQPKALWRLEGVEHCGGYFADREQYVERMTSFFSEGLRQGEHPYA